MKNRPEYEDLTIGVVAMQGSFAKHAYSMGSLGIKSRAVRTAEDLKLIDAMILPEGESTTMTVEAFDLNDNLIGTVSNIFDPIDDSFDTYNESAAFIGFSSDVPIYYVKLQAEINTATDNLTFVSIPERWH